MTLLDDMKIQIAGALQRKASTTCSRWTQNYVVFGKPVPGRASFKRFPWALEMHDCDVNWVGKKAAQMAYTQAALDRAIFTIDVKRIGVLYILPKKNPDAADFSKSKFDSMLNLSKHLEDLFSNTRNIGHKQSGSVDFFLRGARSRSGLKSISVGLQVYDEFDEMPMANIALAEERSSGYDESDRQDIKISTPTIPGFGIDALYEKSTQERFFFKCPNCDKWTEMTFPECLVIETDDLRDERKLRESYYICREPACRKRLDNDSKIHWLAGGEWHSTANANALTRGFGINQFYSTTIAPWKIAKTVLESRVDQAAEQELHNSKLGNAHEVAGARVSEEMYNACIHNYSRTDPPPRNRLITIGIDVGKVLHVTIAEWLLPSILGPDLNMNAVKKILDVTTVQNYEDLDTFMYNYSPSYCVIDANPDTRSSYEFALRFAGIVSLCYFTRGINGKQMNVHDNTMSVHVHRSSWLDVSQGRYIRGPRGILIPRDLPTDHKNQIKALVRKPGRDPDGNPIVKYISKGVDHFAFSEVYSEIALPLAVSRTENHNVTDFL